MGFVIIVGIHLPEKSKVYRPSAFCQALSDLLLSQKIRQSSGAVGGTPEIQGFPGG